MEEHMFRRLLALAAALALPAVLVAQARPATSPTEAGAVHPSTTQRLGDVVRPPATDAVPNQATGDKDEQEGPEANETPEATEGSDADEGPDAKETPEAKETADADEGPEANEGPDVTKAPDADDDAKVERSAKAEQGDDKQGENEMSKPVAPAATGRTSRIGSHRP
jgi:hypothetical protein